MKRRVRMRRVKSICGVLIFLLTFLLTSSVTGINKTIAGPGGRPPGGGDAISGTFDHIEIEITGKAEFTIDGVEYSKTVPITTTDTFTVKAYTLDEGGNKVDFTNYVFNETKEGNGSTEDSTVELSGSYPTGTKSSPVYYVVTLVKEVSFTLNDGSEMTVPVTLTVTTHYWDPINHCPGISHSKGDWESGKFIGGGSGIDVPISGAAVGQAITKGKLAIQKNIYGNTPDTSPFTFYVQNSEREFLTFDENGAYTGTSASLTDACIVTVNGGSIVTFTNIPAGIYRITEQQKDGYIISDSEGADGTNYTLDYIVEEKNDDSIPIATFTNKKLSDEAGISIRKVATGLPNDSYPYPSVSIYAVDENGNKTGKALWTGTLDANGDVLYLNTTLPDGIYLVEENGQIVEGTTCTTSLSGGETVDGMLFTVSAGNRYDLVVTNTYKAATSITINKTVTGNLGDYNKEFTFTARIVREDGTIFVPTGYEETQNGEFTFTLKHDGKITFSDIPLGSTFTVTENVEDGYIVSINGEVDDNASNTYTVDRTLDITFTNNKDVTIPTGVSTGSNLSLITTLILCLAFAAVFTASIVRRRCVY